jgi:hypothetical protein
MAKLSLWLFTVTFSLAVTTPFAISQEDNRPLGDVAREVRAHKGVVTERASSNSLDTASVGSRLAENSPTPGQAPSLDAPVADEPNENVLMVPAGTSIKIDVLNHNVAWPVRDGFTELIPALAKISFESKPVLDDLKHSRKASYSQVAAQKMVRLTSITIGHQSFAVDSDTVTVPENDREITVTLRSPIRIPR